MAYLLVFAIFVALFWAAISLYRYGNIQRQHPIVTLSVLTAWCFSFLIVFTIPLDITSTVYRQCLQETMIIENAMKSSLSSSSSLSVAATLNKSNKIFASINVTSPTPTIGGSVVTSSIVSAAKTSNKNIADIYDDANTSLPSSTCQKPWGMVPEYVFPNLWRIIYWTSQLLTWIIMPLMQSYLKAGDFTIKGKLKSALIDNAIYYGSYLFICGILLIYIAFKGVSLDWQKLKAIASSASNTWGLFLLVLLLGYGLVEIPRELWYNSDPNYTLQYAYFKIAKLSSDKAEAEENVDDILESLQSANRAIPSNHPLRSYIETILRKVPIELLEKSNRNYLRMIGGGGNNNSTISTTIVPSEKALIRIHKQVIKSLQTLQRTEALWNIQVEKVLHLEDIIKNQNSLDRRFKSEFCSTSSFNKSKSWKIKRILYNPIIDWYWKCLLKSPFLKCLSVITGVLSIMVVWSEITFFIRSPVLSIFANIINIAKLNYDFLTIEIISMIILCYLCYCSYSIVLRIKFLNFYYLAPHHQTNENSLIFSGMLLCRLTPAICLNFLSLIHMDSHIIKERIMETYYTQIMGHMDIIGIISDGFNIYFPIIIIIICLATWFNLGSRTLNILGFQQFLHHNNETIAIELIQEGKDLIAREKRRRQRAEEALLRKRYGGNYNSNNIAASRNSGNGDNNAGDGDTISSSYFQNKYRSLHTAKTNDYTINLTSSDDLLRDTSTSTSATLNRTNSYEMTRSLSQEINERFGISAQVEIGFKGRPTYNNDDDNNGNDDNINDFNETTATGYKLKSPPRGIFDDI